MRLKGGSENSKGEKIILYPVALLYSYNYSFSIVVFFKERLVIIVLQYVYNFIIYSFYFAKTILRT